MAGHAVLCMNNDCGYWGYPSLCKDCKRNSMAKEGKYDLYNRKDDKKCKENQKGN